MSPTHSMPHCGILIIGASRGVLLGQRTIEPLTWTTSMWATFLGIVDQCDQNKIFHVKTKKKQTKINETRTFGSFAIARLSLGCDWTGFWSPYELGNDRFQFRSESIAAVTHTLTKGNNYSSWCEHFANRWVYFSFTCCSHFYVLRLTREKRLLFDVIYVPVWFIQSSFIIQTLRTISRTVEVREIQIIGRQKQENVLQNYTLKSCKHHKRRFIWAI